MNRSIQLKQTTPVFLVVLLLCFGVLQGVRAVVPPPDGGYPNFTTAEGTNALQSLTTGSANTAVGWFSLFSNTEGSFNTATGAGALLFGSVDNNTAFGAAALLFNTIGSGNTAVGTAALLNNTEGSENTANGYQALFSNNGGFGNIAIGSNALSGNTTGGLNIALGWAAGGGVTTANEVICIGASGENVNNSCYIGSIFGQASSGGSAVFINASGKLGTSTSSQRFKEGIKPMDHASEALFSLKPVTFRYKKEIDSAGTSHFGLVVEEVEKVNPDLIVRDKEGKPYTVRYDQVNAMLLNEFLKAHRKVQELETNDAEQQREIKALVATVKEQAAQIQKVSAQLEGRKPAPQVVNNP